MDAVVSNTITLVTMMSTAPSGIAGRAEAIFIVNRRSREVKVCVQELPPVEGELEGDAFGLAGPGSPTSQRAQCVSELSSKC
jgi:hypothetical protein